MVACKPYLMLGRKLDTYVRMPEMNSLHSIVLFVLLV